jgi:hypothetical protein
MRLWKELTINPIGGYTMNKKQQQRENIMVHGLQLNRIFNLNRLDPMTLCKQVHRIEVKAHRMAENYCNGIINDEFNDRQESSVMKSLDKVLNYKAQGIPVIFNGDPRGYALKIDDEYVKTHDLDIHRDLGGYGIIAPEF